jgi:hypothetical protein
MRANKRIEISAAIALVAMTLTINDTVLAACNATVNGRPMSAETCALSAKIYGQVLPGDYLMDGEGNWVNANNPLHRGNIYSDARSGTVHSRYGSGQINRDGSWSHYNDLTGNGGVGGWNEGGKDCYYAYGWSNC